MQTYPILSVIVPVFNEERRVGNCLDALFDYLPRHVQSWQVIIVDDGSTDKTWTILETYKQFFHHFNIVKIPHAGKGRAVKIGMLYARGEYRLFMDCDLSTPLDEIGHALEQIARADVVIGSREVDRGRITASPMRRILGRVLHSFVADLVPERDTQCGFKMFRDYAAKDIFEDVQVSGVAFDVECLFLAHRKGYTVKEMPVCWEHDPDSRMRVSMGLEFLRDVITIPWMHTESNFERA